MQITFQNEIIQKMVFLNHSKILIQQSLLQYLNLIPEDELLKLSILILQRKKPEERTNYEIDILMHTLKSFSFFERLNEVGGDLSEQDYVEYCRYLELEYFTKGQYVFQKGDKGDKFYIILLGSAEVLIPEQKEVVNEEGLTQMTNIIKRLNVIGKKSHFGELALLNDAPRMASIRCKENCFFGIIKRESFIRVIGEDNIYSKQLAQAKINELNRRILFFKSIQLFSKLTNRTIQSLLYHFTIQSFALNQVVYKEDDESSKIYIIKEGQFKIIKDITVKRSGNEDKAKIQNMFRANKITKIIEFSQLGPGEIFGELECLTFQKRHFTVIASSIDSSAYVISNEDFQSRVLDFNQNKEVSTFITKYIKEKMIFRNQRLYEIYKTINQKEDYIFGSYPLRGTSLLQNKLDKSPKYCSNLSTSAISQPSENKLKQERRVQTEENESPDKSFNTSSQKFYQKKHFTSKPIDMLQYVLNKQMNHMGQFEMIKDRFKVLKQKKAGPLYSQIKSEENYRTKFYANLLKNRINDNFSSMRQQSYNVNINNFSGSMDVVDTKKQNLRFSHNQISPTKTQTSLQYNKKEKIDHYQECIDASYNVYAHQRVLQSKNRQRSQTVSMVHNLKNLKRVNTPQK